MRYRGQHKLGCLAPAVERTGWIAAGGVDGSSEDITRQLPRPSGDELERLEGFAAASNGWFWETDADHRFTFMSQSVFDVVGVRPEWHYGKTRQEIGVPASVSTADWNAHLQTMQERRPFRNFTFLRAGPSGDQWLRTSGNPVFDEDGVFLGYRGVAADITAEIEALQRANQLADDIDAHRGRQQELIEAVNRLNASNLEQRQLSRSLAHDLKSPIAAVLGVLDALRGSRAILRDASAREYLEMCAASLSRMLDKISEAAEAAVGGRDEDRSVDLNAVLRDIVSDLRLNLELLGGEVDMTELPEVRGDPRVIKAIFHNLLSNAIKYRSMSRALRVHVSARPADRDGMVEVAVADNGRGVLASEIDRIFEPGFRGSNVGDAEGAGAGLDYVRSAAQLLGGDVLAERRTDGTTFVVRAPSAVSSS